MSTMKNKLKDELAIFTAFIVHLHKMGHRVGVKTVAPELT